MATFRYFATCQGQTVQLMNVYFAPVLRRSGAAIPANFVGTCPVCRCLHDTERVIERKANASNHKCDSRCVNAKGFKCECACGGKNHGKGGGI